MLIDSGPAVEFGELADEEELELELEAIYDDVRCILGGLADTDPDPGLSVLDSGNGYSNRIELVANGVPIIWEEGEWSVRSARDGRLGGVMDERDGGEDIAAVGRVMRRGEEDKRRGGGRRREKVRCCGVSVGAAGVGGSPFTITAAAYRKERERSII